MRLRRIFIQRLFRLYDHDIPLNLDERVTILYGLNGVGKTIALKMLHGLLSRDFIEFFRVPFEVFRVEFEGGGTFEIKPTRGTEVLKEHGVRSLDEAREAYLEVCWQPTANQPPQKGLVHAEVDRWIHGVVKGSQEPIPGFKAALEPSLGRTYDPLEYVIPRWWKRPTSPLSSTMLDIHRLSSPVVEVSPDEDDAPLLSREPSREFTVAVVARRLAEQIRIRDQTYSERSQQLDATYPQRLLETDPDPRFDLEALKERLRRLEERQHVVQELGLLERGPLRTVDLQRLDDSRRTAMSIYVEDTETKLAPFDDLVPRLVLLRDTLLRRFRSKRPRFSRDVGLRFFDPNGEEIPLLALSSGEQHDLVMLHHLIFEVKPGTLVLIDEPELSLHLGWQTEFMGDLVQIAKLNQFDAIVATHSPYIVGEFRHLRVELKAEPLPPTSA